MLRAIYQYLKNLYAWLSGNDLPGNPRAASELAIGSDEVCARFLFNSKDFSLNSVKDKAFQPSSRTNNVSIYISSRFTSAADFALTRQNVSKTREQRLKAQAEFLARAVDEVRNEELGKGISTSLHLALDEGINQQGERTNPNHANIEGWPTEKEHRMMLQKALAAKCRLVKIDD